VGKGKRGQSGQKHSSRLEGHSGYWPLYQSAGRSRGLALFDGRLLATETGESLDISDYESFVAVLSELRADVYTHSLLDCVAFPYLFDALNDPHATVLASTSGGVVGITWQFGRRTVWLASTAAWGEAEPTPAFLRRLRALFRYCGVGTYATPAALGEAVWRASREGERISCPSLACARDLHAYSIGGRADTPGLGLTLAEAFEQDMRSAYVHLVTRVPAGTAASFLREPEDGGLYASWFARCVVSVPSGSAVTRSGWSPVPVRGLSAAVAYPAFPGTYGEDGALWPWKQEVQAARKGGCDVQVQGGWGWPRMDNGNTRWAAKMVALREGAPSEDVAKWIKTAAVAAIGRHAAYKRYSLVLDSDQAHDIAIDTPLCTRGGRSIAAWLHPLPEERRFTLPHWFYHTVMRCRLELFNRARHEEANGNEVVALNFDAIYTKHHATLPTTAENVPGAWREIALRDASFPAARHVEAYDANGRPISKRPGLAKDSPTRRRPQSA